MYQSLPATSRCSHSHRRNYKASSNRILRSSLQKRPHSGDFLDGYALFRAEVHAARARDHPCAWWVWVRVCGCGCGCNWVWVRVRVCAHGQKMCLQSHRKRSQAQGKMLSANMYISSVKATALMRASHGMACYQAPSGWGHQFVCKQAHPSNPGIARLPHLPMKHQSKQCSLLGKAWRRVIVEATQGRLDSFAVLLGTSLTTHESFCSLQSFACSSALAAHAACPTQRFPQDADISSGIALGSVKGH